MSRRWSDDHPCADVAAPDECSSRSKAWLWVAVTQVATVFTIAGTRGAKVIREMLGENYNRVLT